MGLKRIVAPASSALALADLKARLKIEHDDDDGVLGAYLAGAIDHTEGPEGFTGRALVDQTWDLYLDHFPGAERWHGFKPWHVQHSHPDHIIEIPLPPLIEVLAFKYQDAMGVEQDVDASTYVVDTANQPGRIVLLADSRWPTAGRAANAVRIRFRAGYLDQTVSPPVDAVPEDIKNGLFLLVLADYGAIDAATADKVRTAAEGVLRGKRKHRGLA